MKHKTRLAIGMSILCSLFSASVLADETQDSFLTDLTAGLKARWKFVGKGEEELPEYKEELIQKEYKKISKYKDKEFEDTKFGELVSAYLEALELQNNSLKYYQDLFSVYEKEWDAGYAIRQDLLKIFSSQYGLDIVSLEEDAQKVEETQTEPETEKTTESDGEEITPEMQEIVLFEDDEILVKLGAVEENDFFLKMDLAVENHGEHQIVVTNKNEELQINEYTVSFPLYVEAGSGKTVHSAITLDKKYSFVKEEEETEKKKKKTDEYEPPFHKVSQIVLGIKIQDEESGSYLYSGKDQWINVDENYCLNFKPMEVTKEIVQQVQELLNAAGYDCGNPDGLAGPNTNEQIKKFAKAHGLPESESITTELMEKLQAAVQ